MLCEVGVGLADHLVEFAAEFRDGFEAAGGDGFRNHLLGEGGDAVGEGLGLLDDAVGVLCELAIIFVDGLEDVSVIGPGGIGDWYGVEGGLLVWAGGEQDQFAGVEIAIHGIAGLVDAEVPVRGDQHADDGDVLVRRAGDAELRNRVEADVAVLGDFFHVPGVGWDGTGRGCASGAGMRGGVLRFAAGGAGEEKQGGGERQDVGGAERF